MRERKSNMKIDWKRKLTSRKWWLAVTGLISGLIVIITGNQNIANTVSGAVMTAASVVAYTLAEGFADAANITEEEEKKDVK